MQEIRQNVHVEQRTRRDLDAHRSEGVDEIAHPQLSAREEGLRCPESPLARVARAQGLFTPPVRCHDQGPGWPRDQEAEGARGEGKVARKHQDLVAAHRRETRGHTNQRSVRAWPVVDGLVIDDPHADGRHGNTGARNHDDLPAPPAQGIDRALDQRDPTNTHGGLGAPQALPLPTRQNDAREVWCGQVATTPEALAPSPVRLVIRSNTARQPIEMSPSSRNAITYEPVSP